MPAQFIDRDGRYWPLEIDFPDVSRIKKEVGVDLMTEEGLARLSSLKGIEDYETAAKVLYLAWSEACDKHGVTDEQFGRLVSKHFVEAVGAFNEALCDFFHRVGMRPMARMIEAAMALQPEATKRMDEQFCPSTCERLLTKSMRVEEKRIELQLAEGESLIDQILGTEPMNSPR